MTSTTSRPFIVELVGPAGVGKTTLSQILAGTWIGGASTIWGQPRKMLLTTGIESFPSFVPLWRLAGSSLWNEITHMVRLRTLERSISAEHGTDTLIFDEGPVFALTWLRGFGHPVMRSLAADQWWQTTLRSWARLIDVVVVLDAPDSLLAERIRTRPHDHEIKQASDPEIALWMARFREALEWVITELTKAQGPSVIRIDTASLVPEQLAQRVFETLDRGAYAG